MILDIRSADEALILQKALDEQRDRIAESVKMHCCQCYFLRQGRPGSFSHVHETACPIAIATAIRSGKIEGDKK